MEKLPLINLTTGKPEWVRVKDILYGHVQKEKLHFYTMDDVYLPISTIRDFIPLLQPLGFEQLEKSNIVNISNVVSYDNTLNSIYFDKNKTKNGILVSRRNRGKIRGLTKK